MSFNLNLYNPFEPQKKPLENITNQISEKTTITSTYSKIGNKASTTKKNEKITKFDYDDNNNQYIIHEEINIVPKESEKIILKNNNSTNNNKEDSGPFIDNKRISESIILNNNIDQLNKKSENFEDSNLKNNSKIIQSFQTFGQTDFLLPNDSKTTNNNFAPTSSNFTFGPKKNSNFCEENNYSNFDKINIQESLNFNPNTNTESIDRGNNNNMNNSSKNIIFSSVINNKDEIQNNENNSENKKGEVNINKNNNINNNLGLNQNEKVFNFNNDSYNPFKPYSSISTTPFTNQIKEQKNIINIKNNDFKNENQIENISPFISYSKKDKDNTINSNNIDNPFLKSLQGEGNSNSNKLNNNNEIIFNSFISQNKNQKIEDNFSDKNRINSPFIGSSLKQDNPFLNASKMKDNLNDNPFIKYNNEEKTKESKKSDSEIAFNVFDSAANLAKLYNEDKLNSINQQNNGNKVEIKTSPLFPNLENMHNPFYSGNPFSSDNMINKENIDKNINEDKGEFNQLEINIKTPNKIEFSEIKNKNNFITPINEENKTNQISTISFGVPNSKILETPNFGPQVETNEFNDKNEIKGQNKIEFSELIEKKDITPKENETNFQNNLPTLNNIISNINSIKISENIEQNNFNKEESNELNNINIGENKNIPNINEQTQNEENEKPKIFFSEIINNNEKENKFIEKIEEAKPLSINNTIEEQIKFDLNKDKDKNEEKELYSDILKYKENIGGSTNSIFGENNNITIYNKNDYKNEELLENKGIFNDKNKEINKKRNYISENESDFNLFEDNNIIKKNQNNDNEINLFNNKNENEMNEGNINNSHKNLSNSNNEIELINNNPIFNNEKGKENNFINQSQNNDEKTGERKEKKKNLIEIQIEKRRKEMLQKNTKFNLEISESKELKDSKEEILSGTEEEYDYQKYKQNPMIFKKDKGKPLNRKMYSNLIQKMYNIANNHHNKINLKEKNCISIYINKLNEYMKELEDKIIQMKKTYIITLIKKHFEKNENKKIKIKLEANIPKKRNEVKKVFNQLMELIRNNLEIQHQKYCYIQIMKILEKYKAINDDEINKIKKLIQHKKNNKRKKEKGNDKNNNDNRNWIYSQASNKKVMFKIFSFIIPFAYIINYIYANIKV